MRVSDKPVRVFGFHHAGGTSSAFFGWRRALGSDVTVIPVTFPGRGRDGRSPRYTDMPSLVGAIADDLAAELAEPHIFYGHSMGALVAYRLTKLRTAAGLRPPDRLMVGAAAAPHLVALPGGRRELTDAELARWVLDVSDVPSEQLDGTARLGAKLARLRADLAVWSAGRETEPLQPPLGCPIDVFAGENDPLVPTAHAAEWRFYSTARCEFHLVAGGHFFHRDAPSRFFDDLRSVIMG